VTANYVKLSISKGLGIYHYDVSFEPQLDRRDDRFRCLNQHREALGNARAFDGVKLFVPRLLPDHLLHLESISPFADEAVRITLTFKRQVGYGEQEAVSQYNVLFRRVMQQLKMVQMRRNFYNPAQAAKIPEHRLEIWPGFVTAVDEYEGGLMLQCDVSHRVLRTETVYDALKALEKTATKDLKTAAEKELLNAVVLTRYNNKLYKIDDILWDNSPRDTFLDSRTNQHIAFVDYYSRQYGKAIVDPSQPMLVSRPRVKAEAEKGVDKEIWLVPELCHLTGLTERMKNDFRLVTSPSSWT